MAEGVVLSPPKSGILQTVQKPIEDKLVIASPHESVNQLRAKAEATKVPKEGEKESPEQRLQRIKDTANATLQNRVSLGGENLTTEQKAAKLLSGEKLPEGIETYGVEEGLAEVIGADVNTEEGKKKLEEAKKEIEKNWPKELGEFAWDAFSKGNSFDDFIDLLFLADGYCGAVGTWTGMKGNKENEGKTEMDVAEFNKFAFSLAKEKGNPANYGEAYNFVFNFISEEAGKIDDLITPSREGLDWNENEAADDKKMQKKIKIIFQFLNDNIAKDGGVKRINELLFKNSGLDAYKNFYLGAPVIEHLMDLYKDQEKRKDFFAKEPGN